MLKILGVKKRGTNAQIAEKYNVSENDIKKLQKKKIRYLYNKETGEASKVDISEKPLLVRKFGIKRINNKLITGGNIKKDITVFKSPISLKLSLTGVLSARVNAKWLSSGKTLFRPYKIFLITIDKEILENEDNVREMFVNKLVSEYPILDAFEVDITIENIEFQSNEQVKLKITNMKLKGAPLDITSIYGENVSLNVTEDNCVREYILKNYYRDGKGIGKKQIDNLGNKDGVDTEELFEFAIKHNIKMVVFDISGNIIKSNYVEKKSRNKNLVGIAYNNHFYPLKNPELHRIPTKKIEKNVYCEKIDAKLIEILEDRKYPNSVSMSSDFISNIQIDDTIYHCNKDYSFCNKILNKLGLGDKMTHYINKINIADIIEKLFVKNSIDSFFPYNSNECGYSFFNEEIENEVYMTIDHNKHYSDALRRLDKLIVIDIKTAKYIKNPTELSIDYFYIASPTYSNILMPKTGFYSYSFLTYCKNEGVEFTLKEAIKCEYKDNFFNEMINTLYSKLGKDDFKEVINCMIGKFEKKGHEKQYSEFVKIANEDETNATNGFVKKLNDDYNLIYKIVDKVNTKIYNRVPIRVQALCEARKIVYEKMKELKLTNDNIKQIRTDAITFTGNKKVKNGGDIGEWKIQTDTKFYKNAPVIIDIDLSFELEPINEKNSIWIDYAGSGKTHYIINELIPTLTNYIVLSPSHASIKQYRSKKINCNVIQKYIFNNELPSEDNIIIDEIGMVDGQANNMIIKCALSGKNIYSFGDFGQLKPVNSEVCNNEIYLKYLYNNIKSLGTNYRNDFTKEYYNELMNTNNIGLITDEIKKYNTKKFYDAETIICYKNSTKDKYNTMMINHLKIKFGDIGCKIVCKTNDLRDKGLYNNFYYTVIDNTDGYIISDGIEKIELNNLSHFELGYCRTLYNIQGESIKSFYFCMEDIKFIDGRSLYTLISRLKTKD